MRILALLIFVFTGGCARSSARLPATTIRGGWLAESGGADLSSPAALATLDRLYALGVRSIAVGPEIGMTRIDRPDLDGAIDETRWRSVLRELRRRGFDVMLLPRIESPQFFVDPFPYRADLRMESEEQWGVLESSYREIFVRWARIAREEDVQILGLGLEYLSWVRERPAFWRGLAVTLRNEFPGRLTYSSNWWREWEEISFWDALDFIGIGAYFAVAERNGASVAEMTSGWNTHALALSAVSRQWKRPILFTEVGYSGFADAGRYPWRWTEPTESRRVDWAHQAACYDALFTALGDREWFAGAFAWRFYTEPTAVDPSEYQVEGRPAAEVLRRWYR